MSVRPASSSQARSPCPGWTRVWRPQTAASGGQYVLDKSRKVRFVGMKRRIKIEDIP